MAIDWRRARPGGPATGTPSSRARLTVPGPTSRAAVVRAPSVTTQQRPRPPLWALVRRPAQITLAVTLLRLAGEKLDGAPELFSRDAGGGLAWVGIVWLAPVFGFFFGWKLHRRGLEPPSLPRLLGLPVLALLLPFVAAWVVAFRHPLSWTAKLGLWGGVSIVAGVIAALAWPAIGRLLFAYALLARLPVVLLMAAAMRFRWGTHYDALPPGFPDSMPLLERWLWLGLLPQTTIWIAFTIAAGVLCGAAGWYAARSREA